MSVRDYVESNPLEKPRLNGSHGTANSCNLPSLQSDGVWTMETTGAPIRRKGSQNFTQRELLNHQATGHFSDEVLAALKRDRALAGEIATRILDAHVPESYHPEILAAVGFDPDARSVSKRLPRDPRFRDRVLTACRANTDSMSAYLVIWRFRG